MHVRVRIGGIGDSPIVVVPSRLTKIKDFRKILHDKFQIAPELQRLFYGGKLLEDGCTFHDYNIKLNDVIQLMPKAAADNNTKKEKSSNGETADEEAKYEDAVSLYYNIGDLVDVRLAESHAWFEGKVCKILRKVDDLTNDKTKAEEKTVSQLDETTSTANDTDEPPKTPQNKKDGKSSPKKSSTKKSNKKKTDVTPQKGIADYFKKQTAESPSTANGICKETGKHKNSLDDSFNNEDDNLFYKVALTEEYESTASLFQHKNIRPRSRNQIKIEDLKVNDIVLINYNIEEPKDLGYWYDFLIEEINKSKKSPELFGTIYHRDVSMPNTKITHIDKIFAIEKVIPLKKRSEKYNKLMKTPTEIRKIPVTCRKCQDAPGVPCKECGCNICISKENPNEILLCDECNRGYHMTCLDPPVEKLPSDDWYCHDCKRDTSTIIAPGAASQTKKSNNKAKKDWGKGMACVGKTQTCSMPPHHFGPIPGIEVGMMWRFRIQLSESGVHRPPVSGIHGRDTDGAYSIVLSGGYEDDYDNGFEFTYTGSGGRDLSGNKRTAEQSCDQTLTRENKALARSCAVKEINDEKGADAGDNWKDGKPVRVVRSYKMLKHFPEYAPKEGIRYDGIYKVVKYYPETGKSGFRVWKYQLRRDDPNLAPWEKGAKVYPIIYPDGYLEAEAEKRALKEKEKLKNSKNKRVLKEKNGIVDDSDEEPEKKKRKRTNTKESPVKKKMNTRQSNAKEEKCITPKKKNESSINGSPVKSKKEIVSPFTIAAKKPRKSDVSPKKDKSPKKENSNALSESDYEVIHKDSTNSKLWDECIAAIKDHGRQGFINKVMTLFLCIICQDVTANPVTTSCGHNFCMACLKLAFKRTESQNCPYCRFNLKKEELSHNDNLKNALKTIMPGYDAKRK